MKEYIDRIAVSEVLAEFGKKTMFAYTDLIRSLAKIPVADVVGQKHGKWMGEYNGWEDDYWCSECKSQALYKEGGSHDQTLSKYCPNCGAAMESADDI